MVAYGEVVHLTGLPSMSNINTRAAMSPETEYVVEAHHRVKNTLQNIISYINVMFATSEQVSREQLQKLIRYVHSLSIVHDILLSEFKQSGDSKQVRIDRVAANIFELASIEIRLELPIIPQAFVTTRRAATLCLVLNEVLDNAKIHGIENSLVQIVVTLENLRITFSIMNQLRPEDSDSEFILGSGLRIAKLLAEKDLESPIDLLQANGEFLATFSCPVSLP